MFSFKNYVLLKESNEPKIPTYEDFWYGTTQYLEKLPFELYLNFAIQCAEKALPAYEKYSKNDPSVRNLIDAAKTGTVDSDLINKVASEGHKAYMSGYHNAIYASQAAFSALHVGYTARSSTIPPIPQHAFDYAIRSGEITNHEVYDIFVNMLKIQNARLKTQNTRQHLPPILPNHIMQLVKAVQQNPSEDTPRLVLADALEEYEGEHSTTINRQEWDEILAHLRDTNHKWISSDLIFKELLK